MRRHHDHLLQPPASDTNDEPVPHSTVVGATDKPSEIDATDEPSELCEPSDEEPPQGCRHNRSTCDVTDQCAMHLSSLLLKWQEGRQLPECTVNEIANDLLNFITDFQAKLNTVEMGRLQHLGTKSGREQY